MSTQVQDLSNERSCPICLHHWNDPTVLDNCNHIFCFDCIIEWTRLKPVCPLCKCSLELLKHRLWVSSDALPNWDTDGQIENIMELRSEYELERLMEKSSRPPEHERQSLIHLVKSILAEGHTLRQMYASTYASASIFKNALDAIENELGEYKALLIQFNSGASRSELFKSPVFRRVVYKENLSPNSICQPLFNIALNSDYIKKNKDIVMTHITPYVIREVSALTRKSAIDINIYLKKLLDYFTNKIKRQEIVTFLAQRGIENPHQFLNNLLHFASSGQTLRVYDQNSEYRQRRSNFVGDFFPEDDDVLVLNSNIDVEVIGQSNSRHSLVNQQNPSHQPMEISNNNSPARSSNYAIEFPSEDSDDVEVIEVNNNNNCLNNGHNSHMVTTNNYQDQNMDISDNSNTPLIYTLD